MPLNCDPLRFPPYSAMSGQHHALGAPGGRGEDGGGRQARATVVGHLQGGPAVLIGLIPQGRAIPSPLGPRSPFRTTSRFSAHAEVDPRPEFPRMSFSIRPQPQLWPCGLEGSVGSAPRPCRRGLLRSRADHGPRIRRRDAPGHGDLRGARRRVRQVRRGHRLDRLDGDDRCRARLGWQDTAHRR